MALHQHRFLPPLMCGLVGLVLHASVEAQVSSVLIDACSLLEPASKRIECLQQANQVTGAPAYGAGSAPAFQAPSPSVPSYLKSAPKPNSSFTAPSGGTCYVGPRGGTYTITKSGKKNYGGC
jgi:hypothetical protein